MWAGEYLQLGAFTCVALLCVHVAALKTKQVRLATFAKTPASNGFLPLACADRWALELASPVQPWTALQLQFRRARKLDVMQLWAAPAAPLQLLVHALQDITERRMKQASLTLSTKAGLPASIEDLNGNWVKASYWLGTVPRRQPDSAPPICRWVAETVYKH